MCCRRFSSILALSPPNANSDRQKCPFGGKMFLVGKLLSRLGADALVDSPAELPAHSQHQLSVVGFSLPRWTSSLGEHGPR